MQKTYKRTQYLIKPDLQTKYAFMFVLSIGVGINLGVILTLLSPMTQNASWIYPAIYTTIALVMIVLVAAISILFTHKIAGPIYKIERSFRQIMDEKDLTLRVHLRTGDELQELAEEINRLLDHVRNSVMIEQQKSEALLAKLDYLIEHSVDQGLSTHDVQQQLLELREKVENTALKFKLS